MTVVSDDGPQGFSSKRITVSIRTPGGLDVLTRYLAEYELDSDLFTADSVSVEAEIGFQCDDVQGDEAPEIPNGTSFTGESPEMLVVAEPCTLCNDSPNFDFGSMQPKHLTTSTPILGLDDTKTYALVAHSEGSSRHDLADGSVVA